MGAITSCIYNLYEFLTTENEALQHITFLYFGNQNIAGLCADAAKKKLFIEKLKSCVNLHSLDLFNSSLNDNLLTDLQTVIEGLVSVKLRYLNLRGNFLSSEFLLQFRARMHLAVFYPFNDKTLKIIAEDSFSSTPAAMPVENWQQPWSEIELLKMLEVAREILRCHPNVLKIHAHRTKNKQLAGLPSQNINGPLPVSVVVLNGEPALLPKVQQEPATISEYNQNYSKDKPHVRKIKLLLQSTDHSNLIPCIVKTITLKSGRFENYLEYLQREGKFLSLYGRNGITLTRNYQFSMSDKGYKLYIVMPYYAGNDSFQHMLVKINKYLNAESRRAYYLLSEKEKEGNIYVTLLHLLSFALLHSQGIIHNDLKPENCIFGKEDVVTTIDFEACVNSKESFPTQFALHSRWTTSYVAPEVISELRHGIVNYSTLNDAYSAGIIARQLVYPCPRFTRGNNYLFLVLSAADNKILKPHFKAAILQNYGRKIAHAIDNLTEPVLNKRATIPSVILAIAEQYPAIAQNALVAVYRQVQEELSTKLKCYPEAFRLIDDNYPAMRMLTINTASIIGSINTIFKIKTLSCILEMFAFCNGDLPRQSIEVLNKHLAILLQHYQADDKKLADVYYYSAELSELIEFHRYARIFMLQELATILRNVMDTHTADTSVAKDIMLLKDLVIAVRQAWRQRSIFSEAVPKIIEYFNNIQQNTTLPASFKALFEGHNEFIDKLKTHIAVESPKKLRPTLQNPG
jgi:serine/threonine protein kinase